MISEGSDNDDKASSAPSQDYGAISRMAETALRSAEATGDEKLFKRAEALHKDAAAECGSSVGDKLFSKKELDHLNKAKYCSLRADGVDAEEAREEAGIHAKELANHPRIQVSDDDSI